MANKANSVVPASLDDVSSALEAKAGYTAQLDAIREGGAEHLSETIPAAMSAILSVDVAEATVAEATARLRDAKAVRDAQTKFRSDVVEVALSLDPKLSQSRLGEMMFATGYTGANKAWLSREWAIREALHAAKAGKASLSRAQASKLLRDTNKSQRAAIVADLRKGTVPEVAPTTEDKQVRDLPAVKAERVLRDAEALSNLIARCEEMTPDQQARMREILAAIGRKIPAHVVASDAGKATA